MTAVCILDVVAPPMSSGTVRPVRSISLATVTISSSEGVIRPEQPRMSASFSLTASRMSRALHMTPTSTTL